MILVNQIPVNQAGPKVAGLRWFEVHLERKKKKLSAGPFPLKTTEMPVLPKSKVLLSLLTLTTCYAAVFNTYIHHMFSSSDTSKINVLLLEVNGLSLGWSTQRRPNDKANCWMKCPSSELTEICPCMLGWTQRWDNTTSCAAWRSLSGP